MPPPTESFPISELAQRVASSSSHAKSQKKSKKKSLNYDLKKCELLQMVQYSCALEDADAAVEAGAGTGAGAARDPALSPSSSSSSSSSEKSVERRPSASGGSAASAQKVIRCWPVVKLFRRCGANFMVETTTWEGEERRKGVENGE